jgi:hypothetical protein
MKFWSIPWTNDQEKRLVAFEQFGPVIECVYIYVPCIYVCGNLLSMIDHQTADPGGWEAYICIYVRYTIYYIHDMQLQ